MSSDFTLVCRRWCVPSSLIRIAGPVVKMPSEVVSRIFCGCSPGLEWRESVEENEWLWHLGKVTYSAKAEFSFNPACGPPFSKCGVLSSVRPSSRNDCRWRWTGIVRWECAHFAISRILRLVHDQQWNTCPRGRLYSTCRSFESEIAWNSRRTHVFFSLCFSCK